MLYRPGRCIQWRLRCHVEGYCYGIISGRINAGYLCVHLQWMSVSMPTCLPPNQPKHTWNQSNCKWTKLANPPTQKIDPCYTNSYTNVRSLRSKVSEVEPHLLQSKRYLLFLSEKGINTSIPLQERAITGFTYIITKYGYLNHMVTGSVTTFLAGTQKRGTWTPYTFFCVAHP